MKWRAEGIDDEPDYQQERPMYVICIVNESGEQIASLDHYPVDGFTDEIINAIRFNARLIAAAPELFNAVCDFVDSIRELSHHDAEIRALKDLAETYTDLVLDRIK